MYAGTDSSPKTARLHSAEANAPAARRRTRGRHLRTIQAKVAVAALATVSAASMALTLTAGPAGAATKPAWIMTAGNVQSVSQQDPGTTSHFFNTPTAYGAGASLVKTPVQTRYATTPILSYTSYAQFKSNIQSGAIKYPYHWVMYDPEHWYKTPVSEQQNPVRYMTLFGQLAHAHGLKVIQAPVPGPGIRHRLGPPAQAPREWPTSGSCGSTSPVRPQPLSDIFLLQDE